MMDFQPPQPLRQGRPRGASRSTEGSNRSPRRRHRRVQRGPTKPAADRRGRECGHEFSGHRRVTCSSRSCLYSCFEPHAGLTRVGRRLRSTASPGRMRNSFVIFFMTGGLSRRGTADDKAYSHYIVEAMKPGTEWLIELDSGPIRRRASDNGRSRCFSGSSTACHPTAWVTSAQVSKSRQGAGAQSVRRCCRSRERPAPGVGAGSRLKKRRSRLPGKNCGC